MKKPYRKHVCKCSVSVEKRNILIEERRHVYVEVSRGESEYPSIFIKIGEQDFLIELFDREADELSSKAEVVSNQFDGDEFLDTMMTGKLSLKTVSSPDWSNVLWGKSCVLTVGSSIGELRFYFAPSALLELSEAVALCVSR